MIKFKKITVKNFISYGATKTTLLLNTNEKVLVTAPNGSGKTALYVDSIFFSLLGTTFRNIRKAQIPNQINRKDCLVSIELEKDGIEYVIDRGISPDIFKIVKGGIEVYHDLKIIEKQQKLLEELGINRMILEQLIFIGADHVPFLSQSTAQRRDFIEKILNLRIYTDMNDVTKIKLKKLNEDIFQLDRKSKEINIKISTKQEFLDNSREPNKDLIGKCEAYIEAYESKIGDINEEIHLLEEAVNKAESNRQDVVNNINKFGKELVEKLNHNKKFEDGECPECGKEYHGKSHDVSNLEYSIHENEILLSKYNTKLDDEDVSLNNLSSDRNDKTAKYNSAKQKLEVELAASNSQFDQITEDIENLQIESASITMDVDELSTEHDEYKTIQQILQKGKAKALILDDYMPFINTRVNEYLNTLNLNLLFELDSDFNETLRSRYRDNFSYENFSSGEKDRINFALLLTWRDLAAKLTSVETNLLVIDEFSGKFDEQGAELIMDLLNSLEETTVFAIVPIKKNGAEFDSVHEIKKTKNFSQNTLQ